MALSLFDSFRTELILGVAKTLPDVIQTDHQQAMFRWMDKLGILCPFRQYFSHTRTMES